MTLPDGTSVSSGEGGGVRVGGGGAYQAQFTHHMYLPMDEDMVDVDLPAPEDPPEVEDVVNPDELPPPPEDPGPVDDLEISNT